MNSFVLARNMMVPMRDGVSLATDIYRPADGCEPAEGRYPVVLVRTPYNKDNLGGYAEVYLPRGYVLVLQDIRNRHKSEGDGRYLHVANPTEGIDGYDTVEWIAAQPWCNGRIGTMGASFDSITQQVMALHRPPHLTCIWPDVGPINSHAHQAREGGAMQLHMFGALFLHALHSQEALRDPVVCQAIVAAETHMREWITRTPFKPGQTPLTHVPSLEETLFNYYRRGVYDEYWQQESNDQSRHFQRHADIPATFSGGWYDPFSAATTSYFATMQQQNRSFQRLIMGPWWHSSMRQGQSYSGDVDFGPDAAWGMPRYHEEHVEWFDRWLRDTPNNLDNEPPVLIFVMGGGDGRRNGDGHLNHGGRWRRENEWPLARAVYTNYYLQPDQSLATSPSPADSEPARFTFDPCNPVPTISGNVTGLFEIVPIDDYLKDRVPYHTRWRSVVTSGAAHQKEEPGILGCRSPFLPLATRPDILVFQTAPLEAAIEVTGPITVRLWISSSAVDTDFTAKLLDVYPPNEDYPGGYHMNLVDSIIRTRFRNGYECEELMEPGTVCPAQIELPPTSNLFQIGHRIRLDISSSNFPRFDVNPNTGEALGRHTHQIVARNVVYLDAAHPSHVILPIIPSP